MSREGADVGPPRSPLAVDRPLGRYSFVLWCTIVGCSMADVYISDSTFAAYVGEYGDNAKQAIREVVNEAAPGGSDE